MRKTHINRDYERTQNSSYQQALQKKNNYVNTEKKLC